MNNMPEVLIESEQLFIMNINENLENRHIQTIKSENQYNPIDIIIINRKNIKTIYIEFKERSIKFNNKYKSIIINKSKIEAIKKIYKKCVFVFKYGNNYKYIRYNKKLFDTFNTCIIKSQNVINIPIEHVKNSDINELTDYLYTLLN